MANATAAQIPTPAPTTPMTEAEREIIALAEAVGVLRYAPRGARGLIEDAVCGYTILIAQCSRCGLRVNFGDEAEKQYHTMPGGCRP